MATYTHESERPDGTLITRITDGATRLVKGHDELHFMRDLAYAAGDEQLNYDAYLRKCDAIRADYFGKGSDHHA